MKNSLTPRHGLLVLLALAPLAAQAHPGHDLHATFSVGAIHPLTGLDHLMLLLGLGAWSAQQGGAMRWELPLTFMALMLGGALLGIDIPAPGMLEQGIAASVLLTGLLVSSALRLSATTALIITGSFALMHGVAHGTEGASSISASYLAGLAVTSLALLLVGSLGAQKLISRGADAPLRWAGGTMALCGAALSLV